MTRRLLLLGALSILASACDRAPRLDTRTFELRHRNGEDVAPILSPYVFGDRPGAPGQMSHRGNVLTVRETPDNLGKIERVLALYDRPTPSVRLNFRIIRADGAAARDPAIADVEAALRNLFRFTGYSLLAEAVVGGMERSETMQSVSGTGGPYHLFASIHDVQGSTDSGTVAVFVRLGLPGGGAVIETTVNLRAGQTAILGNAQLAGPRGTLILTVKPELVLN